MPYHWDAAATGKYVRDNLKQGDVVITTDVYNSYPYTGQIDYWLWTGELVSWQPYHTDEQGTVRDDTYGAVVIRNIYDFQDVLNSNYDRNVWIICSYSLTVSDHIDPVFLQFFESRQQNFVMKGRDGVSGLYYFPGTGDKERISVKDFIAPSENNKLMAGAEGRALLDFTNPDSGRFLVAGWGDVEKDLGTWATGERSVLYADFKDSGFDINKNSRLKLILKPLPHPGLVQTVKLIVNGEPADSIELIKKDDFGQYEIPLGPGLFSEEINVIEFVFSYSFTPLELGLGPDSRKLAVLFQKFELENTD